MPQLLKMAGMIMAYRTGILVWYDCPIATGKVEGDKQQDKGNEESGLWF